MLARSWPRDLLCMALLVGLAFALIPALHIDWSAAFGGGAGTTDDRLARTDAIGEAFRRLIGPMVCAYMIMGLGFLLCLRCGALDLSMWVVSGLGGVVMAAMILAGRSPLEGMIAGVLAGAAVGAVNGLLVAWARLPSVAVTLVVALAAMWGMQAKYPQRQIVLPEVIHRLDANGKLRLDRGGNPITVPVFDSWHIVHKVEMVSPDNSLSASHRAQPEVVREEIGRPLYVTRMLIVACVYSAVMLAILFIQRSMPGRPRPGSRWALFGALCMSGALSATAGALLLLDLNAATVPTRPVDNLLPLTAAILAGGAFLAGRGRTLLAGVLLPGAMLLCTTWDLNVVLLQWKGYDLHLVLLVCMVLLVHQAGRDFWIGPKAGNLPALISGFAAIAATVAVGASACAQNLHGRVALQIAGLAIWFLAAAVLALSRLRARRSRELIASTTV